MSTGWEVTVGVVIAIGLIGIVVPVLPGAVLVWVAIGGWAWATATTAGWLIFAAATVATALAFVAKYAWPGRRLRAAGVPRGALVVGGLLGLVGFFVVPVVGLFLGFPLGVYLYELHRLHDGSTAWRSTVDAMKATGLSILVELAGSLVAAALWLFGAIALG